ncbi:MAG: response regulator [FCB group bacterium]|nr:response regulator [FCB group bacterium]
MTGDQEQIRILLVDDDENTADLLAETFKDIGADVIVAYDGKDAIQTYLNFQPDIVFSDYLMPEIDGIMLFKAIKALNPDLPFVLFSGYHDKLVNEVKAAGIEPDALMRKPFLRLEKITEVLEEFFPGFKK